MSFFPVFRQMTVLLLMMVAGYAANLCGILTKDAQKWISKLIVNIASPALIINSVTTGGQLSSSKALAVVLLAALVYYIVMIPAAKIFSRLCRVEAEHRPDYEAMLMFSNLGFMGIPVVGAVLGQESVLYLSIFMAMFNIFIFSYGMLLLQKGKNGKIQLLRMVNAGTVSSLSAVILYLLHISIPPLLLQPIASIGNTTTPLAMMVVGASLANFPIRELFTEKSLYLFTLLRLLVLPVLTLVICRPLLSDPLLVGVTTMASAMPVANTSAMIVTESGGDASYIAKGTCISTLLSVLTIPVVAMLL